MLLFEGPGGTIGEEPMGMTLHELVELFNRDFHGHPYLIEHELPFALESDGVVGRFHGLSLHTELETLHAAHGEASDGHQALTVARGVQGQRLSAWTPYAVALDGEAIVHLDRLIRTVHVLNARSRLADGPLWLGVHPLHLRAVPDAHGAVFAGILRRCGVRPEEIVLEFTDTERLPEAHVERAIAGFRSRGYGVAFVQAGGDEAWLERLLRLQPDAIKLGPAHLRAAELDPAERARLQARLARIRAAGVRALLRGVSGAAQAELARELGADGWQGDPPEGQDAVEARMRAG